MKKILLTLCSFCLALTIVAQTGPTPAEPQSRPILISGATAHLGNGQVIEDCFIAFENGKLTVVGDNQTRRDASKYRIIDAAGKHVYPGLIACNSNLGLTEIGAVRATRDAREVGSINPNVRSLIAYNTESTVIPTVRANGVLLAQITPQGGTVSGQSSVVQLDAWNWEDAAIRTDDGIHLNWPRLYSRGGWWTGNSGVTRNDKYPENQRDLDTYFAETTGYRDLAEPGERNLKFESMRGLFDGTKKLYIHVEDAQGITDAVNFAMRHKVSPVIVGGADSWLVADFLKDNNVPVILHPTQALPNRTDSDIDQPFKTPKMLHDAGVEFALAMDGYWEQRNLAFQAGQAIGFGLPYEVAVQAITAAPARILGVGDEMGSLEVGKDATLIIVEGDLLDMRSNKVEHAFIQGREIDLDTKQKQLYQKYGKKLGVSTEY